MWEQLNSLKNGGAWNWEEFNGTFWDIGDDYGKGNSYQHGEGELITVGVGDLELELVVASVSRATVGEKQASSVSDWLVVIIADIFTLSAPPHYCNHNIIEAEISLKTGAGKWRSRENLTLHENSCRKQPTSG